MQVVFHLVSTIRATTLKLKLTATTFTKMTSPQINCNMKETSIRKRTRDVAKSDISLPRSVARTFPFWFERNETGCDYVDFKQQSCI